ncbi:DNA recombination protein RmuC [Jannaschia aquimarina]|uniref:DNA recombination protein RmuC homolog n=1 Tax=Jannaschia aquimarina TaxID=935700 RepID=A0A0D1D645_9RHOB|nr:DNA recombination protein RmuC [Jannaschia aquimarina]KIT15473.1 DNA recombination protein RmuC [Jannaschia aquimarina]SNT33862.1 DNA recombination protein RmuC [Jannaschia aquimarina]
MSVEGPIIWLIAALSATICVLLILLLRPRRDPLAARTHRTLGALHERLARIDAAQTRIETLSADVLGLQDILSNKQARGAFGEIQLRDIVGRALPPDAVSWQATLRNGRRPDCLIHLPDAPMVVDAKFPLESFEALAADPSEANARAFRSAIRTHLRAIHERYLIPGETAEAALMFLPSEAIFAELHAHHGVVVREGFDLGVFTVSPTTCMAVVNTLRAVLRDHRMRDAARDLRRHLGLLQQDVALVVEWTAKLVAHMDQARRDLDGIATASERLAGRAARLETMEIEADRPVPRVIRRASV